MKNIIVCMKQVLDPEIPLSLFKIDTEAKQAILPKATPPVLSPFDENALEAALKIKDSQPANISVISLGKKLTRTVVKAPLAAGADQLFLLEDESFGDFNTTLTANALAAAIKKIGQYDLILCGIQAADTNAGQVGTGIASILGIPCITFARKVEINDNSIRVEKVLPDGYEVIEAPGPAVVTVTYEVGTLREPDVEAFMTAGKKPMTIWKAPDLTLESAETSRTKFLKMEQPTHDVKCEIMEGGTPEEKAVKLVTKLKETKVI
ncbi:MAG: electron transfer flavoprotein subunit beta/FixA family protein [Dehalococcoidales bacterium]|nr:electron transfer flavoprotein subunit beta/FixA family protein [Dehalococcoidales bacterium]